MRGPHHGQRTDERSRIIANRHGHGVDIFGELASFDGIAGLADDFHLLAQSVALDDRLICVTFQALRKTLPGVPSASNTKCTFPAAVQWDGNTVPRNDTTRTARAGSTKSRGMIALPFRIAT